MKNRNAKLSSLILLIFLVTSAIGIPFVGTTMADSGNNDDFNNAESMPLDLVVTGMVNYSNDVEDYYTFTVNNGDLIELWGKNLQSSNGTLNVRLFNNNWAMVTELNTLNIGAFGTTQYLTSVETGGSYFVLATTTMPVNTSYIIDVNLTPQNDAGISGDAPGSASPRSITAGDGYTGEMNDADIQDSYQFLVPQGSYVRVQMETLDKGPISYIVMDQMSFNYNSGPINVGITDWTEFLLDGDTSGDTTVTFDGVGNYTFSINITPQDDAGDGIDAPGSFPGQDNIDLNDTIEAMIGSVDQTDYYRFTLDPGNGLSLSISHDESSASLNMNFVDPSGNQLGDPQSINSGSVLDIIFWSDTEDTEDTETIAGFSIMQNSFQGRLNYTVETALLEQDDAGTGADVPGTHRQDQPSLNLPGGNVTIVGSVGTGIPSIGGNMGDFADRYRFEAAPFTKLSIKATSNSPGTWINLNLQEVDNWINQNLGFDDMTPVDFTTTTDNTWRNFTIELVHDMGGRGNYTVDLGMEEVPDTEPPVINLFNPPPTEVWDSRIEIGMNAYDDRGDIIVEVLLNGNETIECYERGMDEWQCDFDLTWGSNSFEVRGTDAVGNMVNYTYYVELLMEDLILNVKEPWEGQEFWNDPGISSSGHVSGVIGNRSLNMSMDGGNSWNEVPFQDESNWQIDLTLVEGHNEIIYLLTDGIGREIRQTVNVTFRKDGGGGGNNGNGSGNGNGNGNGNDGGNGNGGGPQNFNDFFMLMGIAYCLNPIILGLFIGGILLGLLPVYIGLRTGIRRRRIRESKEEAMDEEEEEEPPPPEMPPSIGPVFEDPDGDGTPFEDIPPFEEVLPRKKARRPMEPRSSKEEEE